MARKIFTQVIVLVCVLTQTVWANLLVFDPENAMHMLDMINQTKTNIKTLSGMELTLNKANSILGGEEQNKPLKLINFQTTLNRWLNFYNKHHKTSEHGLSALIEGYDNKIWSNHKNIENNIQDLLFTNLNSEISYDQYNKAKENKTKALKQAIQTSYSISGINQATLPVVRKELSSLNATALESTNLHGDLQNTNQLLAMMVCELTQMREVQAKQLELLAIMILQPMENTLSIEPLKNIKRI